LTDLGITTVAVLTIETLFGARNEEPLIPLLDQAGIKIVSKTSYPFEVTDFSATLAEIKSKNPEAVIQLSYPGDALLFTRQMIEAGINPKVFYSSLGIFAPDFLDAYGPNREGVTGVGTSYVRSVPYKGLYNPNGGAQYWDMWEERWGSIPELTDGLWTWSSCEVLQQAVEKADTLDQDAIKKVLDTQEFQTILGTFKYERKPDYGPLNVGPDSREGTVLQWQPHPTYGLEPQIISPKRLKTADPIFPKPKWKA